MQNPEFESRQNSFPIEDLSVDVPQLLRVGLVGLLTAGMAIAATTAQAAALKDWRYDPSARQLEVTVKEGVTPRYFLMAQPARIVMDLPDTEVGEVSVKENYSGAIRQVRVSQFQPGLTRIVMELSADAVFAPGQVKLEKTNKSTWVLRPLIANGSMDKPVEKPPIQAPSRVIPPRDGANAPAPPPISTLPPPPPSPEIDLPSSVPPVQSKPSTAVATVPPIATSAQVEALQPATVQSALPPEGSDISPMNSNLMEGDVSLPPVASRSTQTSPSGATSSSLQTSAISAGSPVESLANVSRIAQVSPTEQTTPLPPSAAQSPSDLAVDVTNAVKLDVPPPVALPTSAASVIVPTAKSLAIPTTLTGLSTSSGLAAPQATRTLPVPIETQPLTIPAIAPSTYPTAMEASQLGAIEIPSTLRIATNRPPQVTVPALTASTQTQLAAVPSSIPLAAPPQTAMPPLSLPVLEAPPLPTANPLPAASVTPAAIPRVQPQMAPQIAPQIAPLPTLQPPISSVMQSTAPIPLQSPPLQSPPMQQPQPTVRALQPPISSVMQSGSPMMPLPSAVVQPPISSVMQPGVMQPGVMQSPVYSPRVMQPSVMQPGVIQAPVYSPPAIALGVTQPLPSLPQSTFSEGVENQPATVSVPPLQTPAPAPPTAAVSVPPLQPMNLPAATVTPTQMSPNLSPATSSGEALPPPSTIEFGKSLPTGGAIALNTAPATLPNYSAPSATMMPSVTSPLSLPMMYQSSVPGSLLPAGTMLMLSYPGTVDLSLNAGTPRQEVLILQTEVRDSLGNIVFPRGSYVTGQFDTSRQGSKFIAMAITQGDRAIPFAAESDPISGNREISSSSLALYSGAGALAGGLVSKFSGVGVLLGGAAGAATNLFTSPKPATIQPGQIIQIRMTREVR